MARLGFGLAVFNLNRTGRRLNDITEMYEAGCPQAVSKPIKLAALAIRLNYGATYVTVSIMRGQKPKMALWGLYIIAKIYSFSLN